MYIQRIMKYWLVQKSPVYYGWIVMGVGTLGLIMTSPGQSYVVSIFIEHFIADLGISRSLLSSLYMGATLLGSMGLPFVGRLIDRHGSRKTVTMIAFFFGLACVFMGYAQNAVMLGLGFVAIRFLGQGSLGLVSMNVINQWWIERRGLVMGISGFCVALLGLGLFPVAINFLIPELGWRTTFILQGILLSAGMAPLGYLLYRDKPEQFGLHPDGNGPLERDGASARISTDENVTSSTYVAREVNWTLGEAIRTPAFWVLAGSAGTIAMLTTGVVFHLVSIYADQGLDANTAAATFIPLSITMGLFNLGGGVLADRIPARFVLALALGCLVGALFLSTVLSGSFLTLLFGITMGAVLGLYRVIMSVLWANYFGRLHLGSIIGLAQTIAVASSSLGPLPLGVVHDATGTYNTVLLWAAVLPLLFGIANLFVGKPVKELASDILA